MAVTDAENVPDGDTPPEPCHLYEPGTPAAKPMPNGRVCAGMDGQPCRRCVRMGLGATGQLEFWVESTDQNSRKGYYR